MSLNNLGRSAGVMKQAKLLCHRSQRLLSWSWRRSPKSSHILFALQDDTFPLPETVLLKIHVLTGLPLRRGFPPGRKRALSYLLFLLTHVSGLRSGMVYSWSGHLIQHLVKQVHVKAWNILQFGKWLWFKKVWQQQVSLKPNAFL